MQCYDCWKDIIIPLLSALIGGFVTMLGVIITIKWESKKEKKNRIEAAKPWIYSLDYEESYDCISTNDIYLSANGMATNIERFIIIKSTGNGIGIIERFETENMVYYPFIGRILDKNSVTHVRICLSEKNETLKNMFLYVSDVYGNQYKYKTLQNQNHSNAWRIEEEITQSKRV